MSRRVKFFWKENGLELYFLFSVILMVFIFGVIAGHYRIFPHDEIFAAKDTAWDWAAHWKHYLRIKPVKHLAPARHEGNGVVKYLPSKASTGVTFITSFWGNGNGMRLVGMGGEVLHEWQVGFNEDRSTTPADPSIQPGEWDEDIHGSLLYPNGDVVFNFEYRGLVKVDRCSRVIWRLRYQTHHSVDIDSRGDLWVPGRRIRWGPSSKFPLYSPPFAEEFLLKVSPDGEIIKSISILDIIYNSKYEGILFADREAEIDSIVRDFDPYADIVHMNDIEVLDGEAAKEFPLFEEGYLMVSMRVINTIVVIDPDSERIVWSMTGPFIRQHDPDFMADGHISVFDNRSDYREGKIFGGSRILEIDPVTDEIDTLYETTSESEPRFYTDERGKHQNFPNGNILITEHEGGRAFEVTPDGEIVWSFVNRWDDDEVVKITEATRYPQHYAKSIQDAPPCP